MKNGGAGRYSRPSRGESTARSILSASGIGNVLVKVLLGIVPGNLPCPEQFLPFPPVHPGKSRRLPGREDAPLVERHCKFPLQFDGNDIGREPKRLDDILGNPDSNIGHNRFHLMNGR